MHVDTTLTWYTLSDNITDNETESGGRLRLSSRRLWRCFHVMLWLRPPSRSTLYIYNVSAPGTVASGHKDVGSALYLLLGEEGGRVDVLGAVGGLSVGTYD